MKPIWILLIPASLAILNSGALSQTAKEDAGCIKAGCHNNLIDQRYVHDALEDGCRFCHESTSKPHPGKSGKEFKLVEDYPALCYACHEENNTNRIVHSPVDEGECLECHSPHSSANPSLLHESPTAKLCATCHDSQMWEKTLMHKPIKNGRCLDCHNPHQSKFSRLLKADIPDLCIQCHRKKYLELNKANVHPPFEEDCRDCHVVHSTDRRSLLTDEIPALCFECHDDIEGLIQEGKIIHQPVKKDELCLNCHSPHATDNAALLKSKELDLCLSCHDRTLQTEARQIRNIQATLQSSKFLHEPIVEEGCTTCHNPHASGNNYLLNAPFPSGNYAEGRVESFEICFECHDPDLLKKPSAVGVTNFRHKAQNLHYVHLKGEKGRSCINCHNVHGSCYPHLINDKVPFGKWKMPIKFQLTDKGGRCLPGCHKEKVYSH